MKKIITLISLALTLSASSQTVWTPQWQNCGDPYDYCLEMIRETEPEEYPLFRFRDTSLCRLFVDTVFVNSLDNTHSPSTQSAIVGVTTGGQLVRSAYPTTTTVSEGSNLYYTTTRCTTDARTGISLTTTGSSGAATYNSSTGVLNIPQYTSTGTTPAVTTPAPSRSLSNAAGSTNQFTISTTKVAWASYSVNVSWNVLALVATSGQAFLEYSTDGGTNWVIANQCGRSSTLSVATTGSDDLNVCGFIPANALVRIRPATTNATVTLVRVQETIFN